MTNKEYHSLESISASDLKAIAECPAKWHYNKSNLKEETDAMRQGTAIHTAILEPHLYDEQIAVLSKIDRRTKAGKDAYAEFVESSKEKTIITQDQNEIAQSCKDSVMADNIASQLLTHNEALIEQSLFWTDPETGIECRTRPDYIGNAVIDIKSTRNASPQSFMRDAYNMQYHIQAAFYLDGVRANGMEINKFVFIVIEKDAPFIVQTYVADDAFIERGREDYKKALETLVRCRETGKYPAYETGIQTLELPKWI